MSGWVNFGCVVTGQAAIFLAIVRLRRFSLPTTGAILWRSALLGLPLGVVFDVLIGRQQFVFEYPQFAHDWTFLLLNGSLSYGLAIASAWSLPLEFPRRRPRRHRALPILLMLLAVGLAALLPRTGTWTLVTMFMLGLSLVMAGEAVACLAGRDAVLFSLLDGRPRPFLVFWAASTVVGLLYEVLNGVFPLWSWALTDVLGLWPGEIVIVVFGYFALFHPLFVISRLMTPGLRPGPG